MNQLKLALQHTQGAVLELGMGEISTPFLHKYCAEHGRPLYSYEEMEEWHGKFVRLAADEHHIYKLDSWADFVPPVNTRFGVALVDQNCSPPAYERRTSTLLLQPLCDIIVLHDVEAEHQQHYNTADLPSYFKYHFHDRGHARQTFILSDVVDVDALQPKVVDDGG